MAKPSTSCMRCPSPTQICVGICRLHLSLGTGIYYCLLLTTLTLPSPISLQRSHQLSQSFKHSKLKWRISLIGASNSCGPTTVVSTAPPLSRPSASQAVWHQTRIRNSRSSTTEWCRAVQESNVVVESACAIFKLPHAYWEEAIATACYVQNQSFTPHPTLSGYVTQLISPTQNLQHTCLPSSHLYTIKVLSEIQAAHLHARHSHQVEEHELSKEK